MAAQSVDAIGITRHRFYAQVDAGSQATIESDLRLTCFPAAF